jgi:integrase
VETRETREAKRVKITQTTVKTAEAPASGNSIQYDDKIGGFGIRVTAAGVKSFVLNYRVGGRKRRYTIGKWGDTLPAGVARKKAKKLVQYIEDGGDPLEDRESEHSEPLVADLADDYIKDYVVERQKRASSIYNDKLILRRHVLPTRLWRLRVSDVTRRDVQSLHTSMRATPYAANRTLSLLSAMFSLAIMRGMRTDNPARSGRDWIKRFPEPKRETWLRREQLQRLSDALDAYSDQSVADAMRLLIVTGARSSEVRNAEWSQFDLQLGTWTKPAHTTKEKKLEYVPLNTAALMILERMAESRSGLYLFPGRTGERPRVSLMNCWRAVCRAAGLATQSYVKGKRGLLPRWKPNVRIHDIRHTFASHLVSRGASLHLVGRLLGHTETRTTDRYAHVADGALRNVTNDFNNVIMLPSRSA